MGKRRNKYKYVDYSVIRRASEGDFDALEMVRKRYYAYMLKCVLHALSSLGHRTFRKDEIALSKRRYCSYS